MAAGTKCPKCGNMTFIKTKLGRKCSICRYEMIVPVGAGRGKKCSNCGKYQVFNNKCRNCKAEYK